jgi:aspartyl/asparaginyl beta-hydroxylase (cupin superfamily)
MESKLIHSCNRAAEFNIVQELLIQATEKNIALMIINDFFIQKAHELWIFLQLDQCFNDYEATLIWTRRYLEEHPEGEYSDIQKAFISCFPEHFFSFDC